MVYYAVVLLFAICLVLSCVISRSSTRVSFLSKNHTTAVRALMAILIVFSHIAMQTNVGESIPYGRIAANFVGGGGALGVALFFFLSGFGNYFSVLRLKKKAGEYIRWLADRIIKTIIVFLLAYTFDFVVLLVMGKVDSVGELIHGVITLSMPGTTTWYLKIQLLYYFVIAIAAWYFGKNKNGFILTVFMASLVISLPFYLAHSNWWNGYTGFCFASGIIVAVYKDSICRWIEKLQNGITIPASVILTIGLYVLTIKGIGGYVVQNIMFMLLCVLISYDVYVMKATRNWILMIGKASLPIYLVHIGLIKTVFENRTYSEMGMLLFVVLSVLGSVVVQIISQRANRLLKRM